MLFLYICIWIILNLSSLHTCRFNKIKSQENKLHGYNFDWQRKGRACNLAQEAHLRPNWVPDRVPSIHAWPHAYTWGLLRGQGPWAPAVCSPSALPRRPPAAPPSPFVAGSPDLTARRRLPQRGPAGGGGRRNGPWACVGKLRRARAAPPGPGPDL